MTDEHLMDNPSAERVKKVAALASSKGRRRSHLFLAEGPQPVREALKLWLARFDAAPDTPVPFDMLPELDALYFTPEALDQHSDLAALLDQVRGVLFDPQADLPREARIFLREATTEVLKVMGDAETPQGIIAVCRIPQEVPGSDAIGGLLASDSATRLGAVLAGLQDPGNVGTLIRTADAAGADAVLLTPGTVDPWSPKVVRAAAGSHFHMPVITGVSAEKVAESRGSLGIQIVAAHGYAPLTLTELNSAEHTDHQTHLSRSTLWLFGNEAHGLSEKDLALADTAVSIPLYGQAESLNVAVAGAVCLYASAMAQRQEQPR